MTTMLFAGIPLEGSGVRPLEADLYGAEQQGVDHENISATGNLNVGVVIDYDEHAQRFLSGGIRGGNDMQASIPATGLYTPIFSSPYDNGPQTGSFAGNDNSTALQNTTLATPSSPSLELPTQSDRSVSSSPAGFYAPGNIFNGNSSQAQSESASHHSASQAGNTYNTYNSYENSETTTNNITTNNTENNYYDEQGPGGHGGPECHDGGGMIGCEGGHHGGNIVNNFITNELSFTNTVITETINNTTNIISGSGCGDSLVGDLITVAGNSLGQVVGILGSVVNESGTLLSEIIGTTNNTVTTVANTVDNTVNTATNTVDNALNTVINTADNTLNTATNTVDNALNTVLNSADSTANTVTNTGDNILHTVTNTADNALNTVFNTADNALSAPVSGVLNDPVSSALGITGATGSTISSATNDISHSVASVVSPVTDVTGNVIPNAESALSNIPSVLNANVALASPGQPEASGALVNVNGTVLGTTTASPHAGDSGVVNVDSSILSTSGTGNHDGASVVVNPEVIVSQDTAPVHVSIPEINVALPTVSQAIPIVSQLTNTLSDTASTLHDTTSSTLDHLTDLSALNHTSSLSTAVDTGVLFTGGSVSAGHESSSASTGLHEPVNLGTAIHHVIGSLH